MQLVQFFMFGQVGFSTVWVEIYKRRLWESLPFQPIFAVWVEIYNRRLRESLPFRQIFAFWVEIYNRRCLDSLPFSRVFRILGRDFQSAALGISTYFRDFHLLGRDSRMTATGFSTFSADFRRLGRDSRMTATEFSTFFPGFPPFGQRFPDGGGVMASFCSHVITCTSICTKNSLRHNVPPADTPCLRPQGLISSDSDPLLNSGKSLFQGIKISARRDETA